ncbi:hypothetical protein WJX74_007649 [Apatococcus lobatus]|uniref:Carboxylesterase type B domain-containing protein n=1 Tax=Apatococcus lobatus TaxID=904363 RepID=A0AAW1RYT9_9CHLO
MATVQTQQGPVEGFEGEGVTQYRGIPYAAPPCQPGNRFEGPRAPQERAGTYRAFKFGPDVPQIDPDMAPGEESQFPGEDANCLALNIWTPQPRPDAKLPVLVYIHGGSYLFGSGSRPLYRGHLLAAKGLVVVTINYRTGFEGFGHIPGQCDNRGLLDQIVALQWVQANIAGFGGDPANVTAGGQSAGAGSILCLLCMPGTQGLFHRAILHSPPALVLHSSAALKVTKTLAARLRVEPTLAGFISVPPQALAMASMALAASATADPDTWGPLAFTSTPLAPIPDGQVLPHAPLLPFPEAAASIDILLGYCKDEYVAFIGTLPGLHLDPEVFTSAIGFPQALARMQQLHPGMEPKAIFGELGSDWLFRIPTIQIAARHAALRCSASASNAGKQGVSRQQTHCFEFAAANPDRPGQPVFHTADLPYTFGSLDAMHQAIRLAPERSPPVEQLSERMQHAWVSFCQCGDPKWGCSGWEPSYPVQRLWSVPDQQGQHQNPPLDSQHQVWVDFIPGPLELPNVNV